METYYYRITFKQRVLYFWLAFSAAELFRNSAAQFIGPADVQITKLEQCENPEIYPYIFDVSKTKYNRSVEIFALNITIPEYKQYGFRSSTAKFGDGGYKPGAYNMEEGDTCRFLMDVGPEALKDLLQLLGHEPACPFIPGVYSTDRYTLDYEKLPSNLLYGDFRTDVVTFDGDIQLQCYRVYMLVQPRDVLG